MITAAAKMAAELFLTAGCQMPSKTRIAQITTGLNGEETLTPKTYFAKQIN